MSVDQGVEMRLMTLSPRPRGWTSKVEKTWEGKGRQGEGKGEEKDPWRLERLEAAAAAAGIEFDGKLAPVDASLSLGAVLGEEETPLPVQPRRPRPCAQVLPC